MRPAERPPRPGALTLLTEGEIALRGRLPWSSNGTFLVEVCHEGGSSLAVYKPLRGERPLWDYPPGLYRREVGAWVVSEALGWGLVPETVIRDGPLGTGSVQRWIEADFEEHYFTLLERPEHHPALKAICAFDLLINNGDRKGGHCLVDGEGRIWAIDHGLCLHAHPKLRTVIWDFAGLPIEPELVEDVARLALAPPVALEELVTGAEREALVARAAALVRKPFYPTAPSHRAFPWPLI
ncbi:MAG: SCO1664 family protein [Actinomycetota bacterium]|nr:SCO1664 family protein [Actinomycetota bacterium]